MLVSILFTAGCVNQQNPTNVSSTGLGSTSTEPQETTTSSTSTAPETTAPPATTTTMPQVLSRTMPAKQDWVVEDGVRLSDAQFPSVIRLSDGRYRMYATTISISSFLSTDGLLFTQEGTSVLNEGGVSKVVSLAGGSYRMVYSKVEPKLVGMTSSKVITFKSATSTDGKTFEPENVMRFGSKGSTQYSTLSMPDIMEVAGGLRMFYTGDMFGTDYGRQGLIRSATSQDGGMTWQRDDNVRINHVALNPDVIKTSDGKYFIYYAAHPEDVESGALDIYAAESDDGLKYTDLGMVLSSGRVDVKYNNPSVVEAPEGYRMYYTQTSIESDKEVTVIKSALLKTA